MASIRLFPTDQPRECLLTVKNITAIPSVGIRTMACIFWAVILVKVVIYNKIEIHNFCVMYISILRDICKGKYIHPLVFHFPSVLRTVCCLLADMFFSLPAIIQLAFVTCAINKPFPFSHCLVQPHRRIRPLDPHCVIASPSSNPIKFFCCDVRYGTYRDTIIRVLPVVCYETTVQIFWGLIFSPLGPVIL